MRSRGSGTSTAIAGDSPLAQEKEKARRSGLSFERARPPGEGEGRLSRGGQNSREALWFHAWNQKGGPPRSDKPRSSTSVASVGGFGSSQHDQSRADYCGD